MFCRVVFFLVLLAKPSLCYGGDWRRKGPFSWISHFRLARKGPVLSLLPKRLRPESRGVALGTITLCLRISTRAPLHAQRGGEAPPGDRPGATTRFPRLPARRGHIPKRNSTRGAFALFFPRFRCRAPAAKKKVPFAKNAFHSLLGRLAENGRNAHVANVSLARRVRGAFCSPFSFRMALAPRFPASHVFSRDSPSHGKEEMLK